MFIHGALDTKIPSKHSRNLYDKAIGSLESYHRNEAKKIADERSSSTKTKAFGSKSKHSTATATTQTKHINDGNSSSKFLESVEVDRVVRFIEIDRANHDTCHRSAEWLSELPRFVSLAEELSEKKYNRKISKVK